LVARHDEIVHAHGIGAVGQKALIRAPLVIGIDDRNPEQDLARLNRLLEMGRMSPLPRMSTKAYNRARDLLARARAAQALRRSTSAWVNDSDSKAGCWTSIVVT
jgi:hypothetical protein